MLDFDARSSRHEELANFLLMNFARLIFGPSKSITYLNREDIAGPLVALLRRNYARDVDNPEFTAVIEELREANDLFRSLWDGHVVDHPPLFDIEIEQRELVRARFRGALVCDPIVAGQFALLMNPWDEVDRMP